MGSLLLGIHWEWALPCLRIYPPQPGSWNPFFTVTTVVITNSFNMATEKPAISSWKSNFQTILGNLLFSRAYSCIQTGWLCVTLCKYHFSLSKSPHVVVSTTQKQCFTILSHKMWTGRPGASRQATAWQPASRRPVGLMADTATTPGWLMMSCWILQTKNWGRSQSIQNYP